MFDRLLNRTPEDTNNVLVPPATAASAMRAAQQQPYTQQPDSQPTSKVIVQTDTEILSYEASANPTGSMSADLNKMFMDAGWVVSGRTPKVKGALSRPSLLVPRLSIISGPGKTAMGYLRLPATLTKQLGWVRKNKILVFQHNNHPNKVLLVKSGNNTGYVLNAQKDYPDTAGWIRFMWMLPNPVYNKQNTFAECTVEIKPNNILSLEFNPADIKTMENEGKNSLWA